MIEYEIVRHETKKMIRNKRDLKIYITNKTISNSKEFYTYIRNKSLSQQLLVHSV